MKYLNDLRRKLCIDLCLVQLLDTLFGFFARKTDLYTSPNVNQKPEELILQSFRKWEKVALEKHKKDKAERDEVRQLPFIT